MDISRENLFLDIVAYMVNRCMHSRNQSCVTNGTVLVWRGKVALKLLTQVKCFLNDVRGIFCWILKQNYPLKKKKTFVNYHQPRSKIHLCSVFTKRIMPGEITRLGRGMFKNCVKRWTYLKLSLILFPINVRSLHGTWMEFNFTSRFLHFKLLLGKGRLAYKKSFNQIITSLKCCDMSRKCQWKYRLKNRLRIKTWQTAACTFLCSARIQRQTLTSPVKLKQFELTLAFCY